MSFTPLPSPYDKYSIDEEGNIININTNKKMSPWINKHGYKYHTLMNSVLNKKQNRGLHRLLGLAFLPNPFNYPVIDHIDNDKLNNNLSNLRWCSVQQNNINKPTKNPLGKGIQKTKNKKRYYVGLYRDRKKLHLGTYDDLEIATKIYREAVIDYDLKSTETTPNFK